MGSRKQDDFEERERKIRASHKAMAEETIKLRSKDREFHGLEREFRYCQAQITVDYERSRDLKHPRDVGNARENILRGFLKSSGYLPKKYAVSEISARVVSPSGHTSNEIDIALYDPNEHVTLMTREKVFKAFPIENVYGVIQVKSNLTKRELKSGLKNLASFKKLQRPNVTQSFGGLMSIQSSDRGFAVLFAYESEMAWHDIANELKVFAEENPSQLWPNGVFILNKGYFIIGDKEKGGHMSNRHIGQVQQIQIYGIPERQGESLWAFHSGLIGLLRETPVGQTELTNYFNLPLISGEHSYSFTLGMFAETGNCESHGAFTRKLASDSLDAIVHWCKTATPMNAVRAIHIAWGQPEDEAAYIRQPGEIVIYNPENLPLSEILTNPIDTKFGILSAIGYDSIDTEGMTIWLPYYYSFTKSLITSCPKCSRQPRTRKISKMEADQNSESQK